jgi:hypothetical protein
MIDKGDIKKVLEKTLKEFKKIRYKIDKLSNNILSIDIDISATSMRLKLLTKI